MDVYIEKEFLDRFFIDYNDGDFVQKIVKNVFIGYGNKKVFIDYLVNKAEDLEKLKLENPFFGQICNNDIPPSESCIDWETISKTTFTQTLIFTYTDKEWFEDAEIKGALCFSFNNYLTKIKGIIDGLHFKKDLSNGFDGWEFLNKMKKINFNHLTITDGYILSDKYNQKIDDNIIPILKEIGTTNNVKIDIFTKDLNPLTTESKHKKEKAKKRYKHLKKEFNNPNFRIILYDAIPDFEFDFHDRIIQTNYNLIDCGKGFNLSKSKKSNSQIISETIFCKYTYDRLKNHLKNQKEYLKKIKTIKSLNFLMFPN